jgi:hypothetical protein
LAKSNEFFKCGFFWEVKREGGLRGELVAGQEGAV